MGALMHPQNIYTITRTSTTSPLINSRMGFACDKPLAAMAAPKAHDKDRTPAANCYSQIKGRVRAAYCPSRATTKKDVRRRVLGFCLGVCQLAL